MTFNEAATVLADEVQKTFRISPYHSSYRNRACQIAEAMSAVTGKRWGVKSSASSWEVYLVT